MEYKNESGYIVVKNQDGLRKQVKISDYNESRLDSAHPLSEFRYDLEWDLGHGFTEARKAFEEIEGKSLHSIEAETRNGDFSRFDNLNEIQKGNMMMKWDSKMKHKYLCRHPYMTEPEFFAILDKIADGTYTEEC